MSSSIRDQIEQILFKIGQELKIHKLDKENLVVEIDYKKYLDEIEAIIRAER